MNEQNTIRRVQTNKPLQLKRTSHYRGLQLRERWETAINLKHEGVELE